MCVLSARKIGEGQRSGSPWPLLNTMSPDSVGAFYSELWYSTVRSLRRRDGAIGLRFTGRYRSHPIHVDLEVDHIHSGSTPCSA